MKIYPNNPIRAIRTYWTSKTGRKIKLLTQQDIAGLTGCSQGYVSKVEAGLLAPSVEMLGMLMRHQLIDKKKLAEIVTYYTDIYSPNEKTGLGHTDQTAPALPSGAGGGGNALKTLLVGILLMSAQAMASVPMDTVKLAQHLNITCPDTYCAGPHFFGFGAYDSKRLTIVMMPHGDTSKSNRRAIQCAVPESFTASEEYPFGRHAAYMIRSCVNFLEGYEPKK